MTSTKLLEILKRRFYKRWSTVGNIDGVLVPAGTSTVYDQHLGTNIRRPFLHVRYRASQADDRRYENWITGSAGGASLQA